MTTQPEALALADELEKYVDANTAELAAAELRRLHALNIELLEVLRDIVEGTRLDEFNRNDDGLMDAGGYNFDKRIKAARAAIAKAKSEKKNPGVL